MSFHKTIFRFFCESNNQLNIVISLISTNGYNYTNTSISYFNSQYKLFVIYINIYIHKILIYKNGEDFCFSKIICKFSFKTHQQNLNFSPYYRGVFFCYREMKCKQGVKNFAKHPNKIEIFLCIVEGLFSMVKFFSFKKSISRIIRKEAAQ